MHKNSKTFWELPKLKNERLYKTYESEVRHLNEAINECEEALKVLRKHRIRRVSRSE